MRTRHPTEEQVRQRAYELFLQRGRLAEHALDDWLQAKDEVMQSVGDKIVDFVPTETKKSVHQQEVQTNEPGSFAWFWASSSFFADESLLTVRPSNRRSSDRDNRMAA
jgi:hypothetical protein